MFFGRYLPRGTLFFSLTYERRQVPRPSETRLFSEFIFQKASVFCFPQGYGAEFIFKNTLCCRNELISHQVYFSALIFWRKRSYFSKTEFIFQAKKTRPSLFRYNEVYFAKSEFILQYPSLFFGKPSLFGNTLFLKINSLGNRVYFFRVYFQKPSSFS